MRFKFPAIFIFIALFIGISSCVKEDLNISNIKFPSIVGNYQGITKVCNQNINSSDTICSAGFINKMKIFISNETTIVIEDDLGVFGKTSLNYLKTDNTSSGILHYFNMKDSLRSINLFFNESDKAISANQLSNNDSKVTYELFSGVR